MPDTDRLGPALGVDLAACVASYPDQWGHLPGVVKIPDDLTRYAQCIGAGSVEVVVECGTHTGRSALWFASQGVDVVSIDVDLPARTVTDDPGVERIRWVVGSSTSPETVAVVAPLIAGRRTLVSLDSAHFPEHVATEIALWAPWVTRGCHLVVEDTICRFVEGTPVTDAGPLDAVERMRPLLDSLDFVRDQPCEALTPVTHHVAGWWWRAP